MRLIFFALLFALSGASAEAASCKAIRSPTLRLACYDRAEASPQSAQIANQRRNEANITLPRESARPTSFNGAYIAAVGAYDLRGLNDSSLNVSSKIAGTKVGGAVGYNVSTGQMLLGLEARGQYAFGKNSIENNSSYSAMPTFPQFAGNLTCYSCSQSDLDNYPGISSGPLTVASNSRAAMEYKRPWQTDLSVRFGILFDDWLFFAKAGGGLEKSTISYSSSISGTTCTPQYQTTQIGPQTLQFDMIGCAPLVNSSVSSGYQKTFYNPVVLMGAGVERNIGKYFMRAEIELTSHLVDWGYTYYSPSASMAVGLRF